MRASRACGQIDEILRGTAASVLRAALESGDDPAKAIEQLRGQNLALQHERVRLLMDHGLPADFLDDKPGCPLCGDLGYVGSEPCKCLKRMYAKRLTDQLSTILPIEDQNFDTFHLEYYSDAPDARMGISARENMEYNRDLCVEYAHHFGRQSPNLLLFGSTGWAKPSYPPASPKQWPSPGFGCLRHSLPRARLLRVRQI